jgi:hypothetical protein
VDAEAKQLMERKPRKAADMAAIAREYRPADSFCFVIMSFSGDPQLQDFYDHAVKPVVTDLGYICWRVDEQEFNGSIRDRIIMAIRDCKFVVADVTEARPNCYYELGVAHALGKEVIHLARSTKDIHFDVRDFNFIVYSRLDDLKMKLRKRIESTIGPLRP